MSRFGRGRAPQAPKAHVQDSIAPLISDGVPSAPSHLLGAAMPAGHSQSQEVKLCGCRVEFAHFTAKNWGGRHENEDRFVAHQDSFLPDATDCELAGFEDGSSILASSPVDFFTIGVLDGHDTENASDRVADMLPGVLSKRLKDEKKPVHAAYVQAMAHMEQELKKYVATAGTCVLSCTIVGRYIWCANLGDCRALLLTLKTPAGGKAEVDHLYWMSRDMKASTSYEQDRIQRAGGLVIDGRVEGLEPSRTLGDFDVKMKTKKDVISIVPEVRRLELGKGDVTTQAIIVLATDGVWDVMSGQDMCDLVHARKEIAALQTRELTAAAAGQRSSAPSAKPSDNTVRALWDYAEDLVQFSIARGSRDDCTAIVGMITSNPPTS